MKISHLIFLLFISISCHNNEKEIKKNSKSVRENLTNQNFNKVIKFYEFSPNLMSEKIELKNFDLRKAYLINELKIVTGNFTNENIDFSKEENLNDYGGVRLIALNQKNQIIYKSKGGGDIYLFEPHFYKNDSNGKILIICQLAFEYFCWGEVFLIENNKIKNIGTIDIESNNMEISLTDIIQINEIEDQIIFDFKSDSLILEPGSKDHLIKNNEVKYSYKSNKLTFIK